MSEIENTEATEVETEQVSDDGVNLATANGWLELMDLKIGEEVMLIPVAGGGNGFQGTLLELIVDVNTGPAIFIIEKAGSPRVSINWKNCAMVTRTVGPAQKDITEEDLAKLAEELGIPVPSVEDFKAAAEAKQNQ